MTVHITIPKHKTQEGSSFTATAYFRSGTAASTPTTAQYRIDCLTTGTVIKNWTDLTPAVSNSITITGTDNAIQWQSNKTETKQLTVQADQNTDNQSRDTVTWDVFNIRGF